MADQRRFQGEGDPVTPCTSCGLPRCACRTGRTTITAAGDDATAAALIAEGYLSRRGWTGKLLRVRRRRTRTGVIGYRAWDLEYAVRRSAT